MYKLLKQNMIENLYNLRFAKDLLDTTPRKSIKIIGFHQN